MQSAVLERLLNDFTSAISSEQNDVTLDPAIAQLRARISEPAFLNELSIYSRSQLRELDRELSRISSANLRDDALGVALAVDAVLKLFDRLDITMKLGAESKKRIEAQRSVPARAAIAST